jgi:cyclopropane fatty-acyl-phospholipid synthase-like methyltransferase
MPPIPSTGRSYAENCRSSLIDFSIDQQNESSPEGAQPLRDVLIFRIRVAMNDTTSTTLNERLFQAHLPRSSKYDPHWLMDNAMGPHVLWLTEWLSQSLDLRPGMRVLDLGCGRAISSIFLAKEFGVTVWAADYWIQPSENFERIDQAGCAASVYPVSVEAHALPFARESFDAIVSFDAYHYFGTDDLYVGYISAFLKPGGRLGIVVPGTLEELSEGPPAHLAPYWVWDFCSFHSPGWWRRHWQKTGLVDVEIADTLADGWKLWLEWNEVCAQFGRQNLADVVRREAEMLRVDAGRTLGFTRLIARRRNP